MYIMREWVITRAISRLRIMLILVNENNEGKNVPNLKR